MTVITLILIIIATLYAYLVLKCSILFHTADTQAVGKNVATKLPDTDVIVSAKNEEENIPTFMKTMQAQTLKNCRLLLIDDNSSDNTYQIAKSFCSDKFTVAKNYGHGKKEALRQGIVESNAQYILSTDADCIAKPRWAETLVTAATTNNAEMIMAPVIIVPKNRNSMFQRLWEIESFAIITITGGTCLQGTPVMCNGGNIGYNANFIKQSISDMNQKYESGDDMFMMESAGKQRKKIVYVKSPDAVITTQGVETISQLLNQRARWVSKTGGYTSWYILYFAFVILLGNLALIAASVFTLLQLLPIWVALLITLIKWGVDFVSVKVSSQTYGYHLKFFDILILEIIYPYYVVASIASYGIRGFKWK